MAGVWRLVPAGPAEREIYDRLASAVSTADLLQSYEWGEVKARTGWRPLAFLLRDPSDAMRGASLILKRALPLGRSIFYCPRGPALDFSDGEAFGHWVRLVRREAVAHRAILVKIDPPIPATETSATENIGHSGFRRLRTGPNFEGVQPRFVYKLSLKSDLDAILASFSAKTRYNIRLAERRGVVVREARRADLRTFYDILQETAVRDRFRVRSITYFESLWDLLVEHGLARLFLAEYEGSIIAGTLAFLFGDQCWYVYGASSNRHRNVMPNYALQWAMITWAKERGCRVYDFRGVSGDLSPGNPLYGLYRFKRGFSGRLVEYAGEFDLPLEPVFYLAWTRGIPAYRRWRGRLPRLGRLVRRAPLPDGSFAGAGDAGWTLDDEGGSLQGGPSQGSSLQGGPPEGADGSNGAGGLERR